MLPFAELGQGQCLSIEAFVEDHLALDQLRVLALICIGLLWRLSFDFGVHWALDFEFALVEPMLGMLEYLLAEFDDLQEVVLLHVAEDGVHE